MAILNVYIMSVFAIKKMKVHPHPHPIPWFRYVLVSLCCYCCLLFPIQNIVKFPQRNLNQTVSNDGCYCKPSATLGNDRMGQVDICHPCLASHDSRYTPVLIALTESGDFILITE